MLKKLMKYDFRDQGKTLWPLHLALLLGSVLAGFCLLYYMSSLQKMAEGVMRISAMQVVSIVVMALVMIALMASAIVTQILVGRQYYNNCFCDEGYLTFTLPVPSSTILLSKLITGALWTLINVLAVFLCCALFLLIGFAGIAEAKEGFWQLMSELKSAMEQIGLGGQLVPLIVRYTLMLLIGSFSSMAMLMFVVTMGCQMAKKHKALCIVALYFLLTMVISCISGVMSSTITLRYMMQETFEAAQFVKSFNLVMLVTTIFSVVLGGVLFYFTDRTVANRLNLE